MGWRSAAAQSGQRNATQEVLNLVDLKYVDKVNLDSLNQAAIETIVEHLDPHSIYIPPTDLADVNADLRGDFSGIGVEYQLFEDTMNILYVVKDGPSDKAGVLAGDQFIRVNDSTVAGVKRKGEDLRRLLRGQAGSLVKVDLLRDNQRKQVEIKRGTIPIPSLDASYMAAPNTGYIKLNKFSEKTYIEFMEACRKLQGPTEKDLKNLIIDLRGNGGGLLEAATNIADEILGENKLIVYTQGDKVKRRNVISTKPGILEDVKVVLLLDEFSASASEVLAGALQDNDRCTIVGRRSFGKGLVQEQYGLSDGGALRLTVARYYTPTGRSIQKPYNNGRKLYREEVMERFHNGQVLNGDTMINGYAKGKPFKTPKGKIVYDGGGISPDYFVPFDSATVSNGVAKLYASNRINDVVYQYFKQNRKQLAQYKNAMDFGKQFVLPDHIWAMLVTAASKDSISLVNATAREKSDLQRRLKSLLARQLYRLEGFYEVDNVHDAVISKALELVQTNKLQ